MGVYGRDWVMDWHGFLWSWLVQREGEAGVLGGGLDCLGFGLRIFLPCSCSLGVLGGHRFLRWSSCLVLLGSFSAWFFLLGLVLLPFVLFSGSFLALRCPCALVCGLLPCSSWVLLWLVFFLVFRFPRISIASLGFPSFRLVRFLSGWCFSCPSCRGVLVCFLVLLRVALPFPGRCLVSQGLKQVCSGRKLGMANVCPVSSYPLVLGCPALGSVLLWLGNGASLVWFSSLRSLVLRWHGNPAFLVVGGWWRKACCRLAMVVGSAWLVCPSFFLGLM